MMTAGCDFVEVDSDDFFAFFRTAMLLFWIFVTLHKGARLHLLALVALLSAGSISVFSTFIVFIVVSKN